MDKLIFYNQYFIKAEKKNPYVSAKEYIHDLFCLMDAGLQIALFVKNQEANTTLQMRGITVPQNELSKALYVNTIDNKNQYLAAHIKEDFAEMINHIINRKIISKCNRMSYFIKIYELSELDIFTLLLALSVEYSRNYESIYAHIQNDLSETMPTKGLAISIFSLFKDLPENDIKELVFDCGRAAKIFLFTSENKGSYADRLYLEKHIIEYLLYEDNYPCFNIINNELYLFCKELPDMLIHQNILCKIRNVFKFKKHISVNLYGNQGSGRHYLLKKYAKENNKNFLFISITELIFQRIKDIKNTIHKLSSYLILTNAFLCIEMEDYSEDENVNNMIYKVLKYIEEDITAYFIISDYKSEAYLKNIKHLITIEIPLLDLNEKLVFWQEYGKKYAFNEDIDLIENSNKYSLSANEIKAVLETAGAIANSDGRNNINKQDIISSVKQKQKEQLGSYATLINAVFTWDDLILEKRQKDMLMLICNQVLYKNIVGEKWGFYEKIPYGRGVSTVFYGAPGTGKTMAVQVIANYLGMDLYRIDLSQMVSKYIGETEKNISELFYKAKYMNAILFFDEADSLFAKRLEVKDSNDRNANSMTAHLLQKFEEYEGVTILATNYINNIDDAFKRRIKFAVQFSFPDKKTRYSLFQSIMPDKAECDEKIDFSYFAEYFELSGSSIKEVLVNAAYIAAGEGSGMKNKHIVEAIRLNYMKYGKTISKEELGYWGKCEKKI